MKKKFINVILKAPGKDPELTTISHTADSFHDILGNHIETVNISNNIIMLYKGFPVIDGSQYNCTILGTQVYGSFIICGYSGKELRDYPESFEDFKDIFPKLFKKRKDERYEHII